MRKRQHKSGGFKRQISVLRDMIDEQFEYLNDDLAEAAAHDIKDGLQSKPAGRAMALTDVPADPHLQLHQLAIKAASTRSRPRGRTIKACRLPGQALRCPYAIASSARSCWGASAVTGLRVPAPLDVAWNQLAPFSRRRCD